MSGLVVSDVEVCAGDKTILSGTGFTAPTGAITGLIGPNGAGKSTQIGAIVGLRRLTRGTIALDGTELPQMRPAERARLVAYIEQSSTTSERLTVRDVVALGRIPFQSTWQSMPAPADERVVEAAIDELGVREFADRLYYSLSGGEQQRVQLARALAQEPRLLLLDEPTSHLDIQAQLLVLDLLRRRARAGTTVLLALHDLNLAARFCDHLVVMDGGRAVAEGPPAEVLSPRVLLQVYGVHADIVTLPGSTYPLVVYDRAAETSPAPKSD